MKKKGFLIGIIFIMLLFISPALASDENESDAFRDVIVYLNESKAGHLDKILELNGLDEKETLDQIKDKVYESQDDLVSYLNSFKKGKDVNKIERFFIINAIHLIAKDEVVEKVKTFKDVDFVEDNFEIELSDLNGNESESLEENQLWYQKVLNIGELRNKYKSYGKGVTIGFIDSGASYENEELKNSWRGKDGDAESSWKDFIDQENLPVDDYGHGTGVISIAVGNKEASEKAMGIAPEAKWIAARIFSRKIGNIKNFINAAEWMLAPGGDPAKRPDIISCSFGYDPKKSPSSNIIIEKIVDKLYENGIICVFAGGNIKNPNQEKEASIEYPAGLKNTIAVGSVDKDLALSHFSKRGPSPFDLSQNIVKPDFVAPGIDIRMAGIDGGYKTDKGTSFATPLVTGIIALLKSEKTDLNMERVREILKNTAKPLKDTVYTTSPNMGYGYGMPNPLEALKFIKVEESNFEIDRVMGENRYLTSVEISKKFYNEDNTQAVYLANGTKNMDALIMSTLTNKEEGPLLFTKENDADKEVIDEILRLKPKKIYVIGGQACLTENLLTRIKQVTGIEITRLAGDNRYLTSIEVANKTYENQEYNRVFLSNGDSAADATSISGIAKVLNVPIILTEGKKLDDYQKKFLVDKKITSLTVIGGEDVVSESLLEEIRELGIKCDRIGGKDRFKTSYMINMTFNKDAKKAFVAEGYKLADALAIGPVSGRDKMPIVLSQKENLNEEAKDYLKTLSLEKIVLLGGEDAISNNIYNELKTLK